MCYNSKFNVYINSYYLRTCFVLIFSDQDDIRNVSWDAQYGFFFSANTIADDYLTLMADTDEITNKRN